MKVFIWVQFDCSDKCIEEHLLPMKWPALLPVKSTICIPVRAWSDYLDVEIERYELSANGRIIVHCYWQGKPMVEIEHSLRRTKIEIEQSGWIPAEKIANKKGWL